VTERKESIKIVYELRQRNSLRSRLRSKDLRQRKHRQSLLRKKPRE
jgi:hypothetical protein